MNTSPGQSSDRFVVRLTALLLTATLAIIVADSATAGEAPMAERIAELIPQLESTEFSARQAASNALFQMGKQAFPALAEVAETQTGESRTRAMEVLRRHFDEGDDATREAARATLQKLAEGDGSAARRAAEILNPDMGDPQAAARNQARVMIQNRAFQAKAIQIQMNGQGIQGRNVNRTRVTQRGNQRTIEIERNDLKIKIEEDPQKIQMEVTEKKDGKVETKKYEAKDEADLKKKHPEAHKLYKEHAGNLIKVVQGVPAAAPRVPPAPRVPAPKEEAPAEQDADAPKAEPAPRERAPNPPPINDARKRIAEIRKQHFERLEASIERQKETLRKNLADRPDQLKIHLEALDKHLERMRDRLDDK